jgi:hypothetical protein
VVLFSAGVLIAGAIAGWLLVAGLAALNAVLWAILWWLRRRDIKRRHLWPQ